MKKPLFYPLLDKESSTRTYLIADGETKEAALIDPVMENLDRDLELVKQLGVKLVYVIDTHVHADHITSSGKIKEKTGAKIVLSAAANVGCVDIALKDGQELPLGQKTIRAMATPGHTDSCMTLLYDGMAFTGDALLIRGCGRTDFQQGSASRLYESIQKILSLPADTEIYPAHDYNGRLRTSVAEEKQFNPRAGGGKTREDFVKIMSELKLAPPAKIDVAVPANMKCGLT